MTRLILQVIKLADSAFVRVEHNWVAPDGFKNPIPGLVISKERYWDIRGIIPPNTIIKGKFQYVRSTNPLSGGLDNELITGSIDSLVLLYRSNRAENWRIIPYTRIGTPYTGYLIVDTLQDGEYTFGYWNWQQWIYNKPTLLVNDKIIIYPNPAKEECTVQYSFEKGQIVSIYNIMGTKIFEHKITDKQDKLTILLSQFRKGVYIIEIAEKQSINKTKLIVE